MVQTNQSIRHSIEDENGLRGIISVTELEEAELRILRIVQEQEWPDELKALKANQHKSC